MPPSVRPSSNGPSFAIPMLAIMIIAHRHATAPGVQPSGETSG